MAKVCLDAGHGGKDSGAVGFGRKEKNDVLRMVLRVGAILVENGIDVFYNRTTDVFENVNVKAQKANNANVDFFASFHRNAANGAAKGYETLVYANTGKAKVCADKANQISQAAGFKQRGTKIRTDLAVLNGTKMEAALFEIGFIDNSEDNAIFDSKFEQLARGYAEAIAAAVEKTVSSSSGITSKPAQPSKPSGGYTGGSIVDYLNSIGMDSSFSARKRYAAQYGISNYSGTAAQNTALLNAMRGNGGATVAKPVASYYRAFNSGSIVDGLKSIGVDASFNNRKRIAAANGISNYSGSASQNSTLCNLARYGKLKKA